MKKARNLIRLVTTVENFLIPLACRLGIGPKGQAVLKLRTKQKVAIRCTSTDLHEVISVLSGSEYPKRYLMSGPKNHAPVVFNVGAHIGTFDLFIKNLIPSARVFSFEPEPENFQLLQENLKLNQLQDVEPIAAAVWSESGAVTLESREYFKNETKVSSGSGPQVKAISLDDFMSDRNIHSVDILKMDCEGAEHEILPKFMGLKKCRLLALELHDTAAGTSAALESYLEKINFKRIYKDEHASLGARIAIFSNEAGSGGA